MTMHETFSHPVSHRVVKHPKTAPTVRKVYGENSDNSDYGELRAIVRRIEMNKNSTSTVSSENGVAKKKMVFDYLPASGMMQR